MKQAKQNEAIICKLVKQTKNQTQRENTQLPHRAVHVSADSGENRNHINGITKQL